jgi:chromosome segregation ATPase
VLDTGEDAFARFSVEGASVSKAVREAFQRAQGLRGAVSDAQKKVAEIEQEQAEIRAEQARIRENLNTIDRSGELATRLMRKLSDQETRMENLFESLKGARESVKAAQASLSAYISDLNVD